MLGHRSLNAQDYLDILKRRWWIVVIPFVILPIITYAFSYTIPPQYMSQTLVLIENQKVPDSLVKPIISSDLDSRLASMKEQILSRSSLEPLIERYNLYADKKLNMDDRIDLARKNVDIKPIVSEVARSGGLPGFFISFKASDARTAQIVCSDITSLFTAQNTKQRSDAAHGTVAFLSSQLDAAKRDLDEQDQKMADFERKYFGRLPGDESSNTNMLSSLTTQLQAVTQQLARQQQDRDYIDTMLAQAQSQQQQAQAAANSSFTGPVAMPTSPEQAELNTLIAQRAELLTHYTADHPDVLAADRRIADLRKQLKAASPAGNASSPNSATRFDTPGMITLKAQSKAINAGIESSRKQQAQIQSAIGSYETRIQSSPQVEQEYKQITRDHATAQAFYDDLLAKKNTSEMAASLETRQQGEQFKVMDAANLPDAPFSPKRSVFLMAGIAGGLAIGLLIIAFLEFKDTALRSERDIWAFTQLPTLAVIAFSDEMTQSAKPKKRFSLFKRKPKDPVLAQVRS